jgi:hypothetical protein
LTILGLAKALKTSRSVRIVGECCPGKTLMSMGVAHTHANGAPYTAIAMCPPHLVLKWAREVLITVPRARAIVIYDMRNGGDPTRPHGVVEVQLVVAHWAKASGAGEFLTHKDTTQTTCLRLMGKKMLVALMMEGKFSGEGLHSLESDDDLMSAMTRELVERGNVGESAAAVWADLKREREQQMPAPKALPDQESEPDLEPEPEEELPAMPLVFPPPMVEAPPPTLVHSTYKPKQKRSSLADRP